MTDWWDGPLVGFDSETTHVEPDEARIVTAAFVEVGRGLDTVVADWIVDPEVEIPKEATEVHGITTAQAQAHGRDARECVEEIISCLAEAAQAGVPIFTFNARYDFTVLDREATRYDLEPLQDRCRLRIVDPSVIDRHTERYRSGSRKLAVSCEHYRVKLDEAHDAGADALAAVRLGYRICAQGKVIRRVRDQGEADELEALIEEWECVRRDLDLLHAAQIEWARFQAAGLEQHFAEKGEPQKVPTQWPVVPVTVPA